LLTPTLK